MSEALRGLPGVRDLSDGFYMLLGALAIILVAWLVDLITRRILLALLQNAIRKSKTRWDDMLLEHKLLDRLAHLAPAVVVSLCAPAVFGGMKMTLAAIHKSVTVYVALVGLMAFNAFLGALQGIYGDYEVSHRPIKGYVQVVQIITGVAVAILVIASLMNRSPLVLLGGLGAMTAMLLLVFKDSILGFVASVQLSSNDMVRMGDWIGMPQFGADGEVIDISLSTVKVQNWDKTISTIPTYALVSQSFQNWRGMTESGGRRIKRALNLDMNSIRLLGAEDLERLRRFPALNTYLDGKNAEVSAWPLAEGAEVSDPIHGRRITNLGVFCAYMTEVLRRHPRIRQDMTMMVRQLKPSENGLPVEIYAFASDPRWVEYESVQAEIFEHVLVVLPEFDLRIFQNPTGTDFVLSASRPS